MAEDKVMKYVEGQLAKDPNVSNATLYEGAKKIDRSIGKLSIRQFHAKYPLQVKRRKGKGKGKGKGRSKAKKATRKSPARRRTTSAKAGAGSRNGDADGVRRIMLRFARELSAADSQVQTIEVLSKLDKYTDEILKAARS